MGLGEKYRMMAAAAINAAPGTREALEAEHGKGNVWDTDELSAAFEVQGFAAPFCMVRRRSDGVRGAVMFQHRPRFYFTFTEV